LLLGQSIANVPSVTRNKHLVQFASCLFCWRVTEGWRAPVAGSSADTR